MPVTVLGEHALTLPTGNTAARPASPTAGMTRYSTTFGTIEYYNGSSWIAIGLLDGSTSSTAAPSATYIKAITGTTTSGLYWIKNSNMPVAVEVYCDMSYDGGGYMLLAYGFVGATQDNSANWGIPNLNHNSTQFSYTPTSRASTHGLIQSPNGQQSALLLAKAGTTLLMAAGNNPSTGGIDSYSYVFRFPIPDPSALTFENHAVQHSSNQNVSTVTVTALKGDSGTYTRYTVNKSLGATWNDGAPTGYGAVPVENPRSSTWNSGPFFPSIHRSNGGYTSQPDVGVNGFISGSRTYVFQGWYNANGSGNTGQTSIWVK
jgi:hypothetical protein